MGDDDTFDLVLDGMQIAEVRHKDIYPMHGFIGEAHAHINNKGRIFTLHDSDIPTDLTESSQRREADLALAVHFDLLPWHHSLLLDTLILHETGLHLFGDIGGLLLSATSVLVAARLASGTVVWLLVPVFLVGIRFPVGVGSAILIGVRLPVRVRFPFTSVLSLSFGGLAAVLASFSGFVL